MSILIKRNRDIYENNKNMVRTVNKKRKILRKKNTIETGEFINGHYVTKQDFETFNLYMNETGEFINGHYVTKQDFETFNLYI